MTRSFILVFAILVALVALSCRPVQAQTFTVLYDFGADIGDPKGPEGLIALGRDGNLYSTSSRGSAHENGTAFRFTSTGAFTLLHHFGSEWFNEARFGSRRRHLS